MHRIQRSRAIVAAMTHNLISKGYTAPDELFSLINNLYPRHGLYDDDIRRIIHRAKVD